MKKSSKIIPFKCGSLVAFLAAIWVPTITGAFDIATLQCTANQSQTVGSLPLHHHPMTPIYSAGVTLLHAIRTHDAIPYSTIQEILDKYVYANPQGDLSSTNFNNNNNINKDNSNVNKLQFVQQDGSGGSSTPQIELVEHPLTSPQPSVHSSITNSQILNYTWKITKSQIGFAIALVLGLAFIALMPIIGIIFCICRCCDRCGGKRYQPLEPSRCRCGLLVTATIVCVLALIAGIAVFSFSNELSWKSLEKTNADLQSQITAIEQFGNNTIREVSCVAERSFDMVMTEVVKELRALPVSTVQQFRNLTGLDQIAETQKLLEQMESKDLSATIAADQRAMDSMVNLTNFATSFIDRLPGPAFSAIPQDASQVVRTELLRYVDFTFLNQLKTIDASLGTALSNQTFNLTKQIHQTIARMDQEMRKAETDLLPLERQIHNINASTRRSMADLNQKADLAMANVTRFANNAVRSILAPRSFTEYSWIPGVLSVLLVPTLLVLLTLVFGLVCGLCGYHRHNRDIPYKRTTSSNFGGNCLIASVVLCFVFSWLMMLVTLVAFAAGYASENFFCDPLFHTESESMYAFIDLQINRSGGFDPIEDLNRKYNHSYHFSSYAAVKSCRNNDALYEALLLSQVINVEKIAAKLTNVTFDLDEFWTYNPNDLYQMPDLLQTFLRTFILSAMQNLTRSIDNYETVLELEPTRTQQILDNLARGPGVSSGNQATATQLAIDLRQWLDDPRQVALDNSRTITGKLEKISRDTKSILTISTNATAQRLIYETVRSYANQQVEDTMGSVSEFGKEVAYDVLKSIGRCRPLYDIWQNVGDTMICQNVANAVHGLWIALGWCVVWYVPTLIFAVLLAKYLHRMDEYYYLDSRFGHSGGGHGGHAFAAADHQILDAYSMPTLQMPPRIHPYNYQRGSKYAYG